VHQITGASQFVGGAIFSSAPAQYSKAAGRCIAARKVSAAVGKP